MQCDCDNLCRMVSRLCLFLFALALGVPAHATDWLRAESDHYIVHTRMSEAELRALMQTIEEFDRVLHGLMPGETQHGRKPELYLTNDRDQLAETVDYRATALCQDKPELAIGYALYAPDEPTMERPLPDPKPRPGPIFYCVSQFHLANAFFRPKPMWVTGGLSQFFATAYRDEKGQFVIGAPNALQPIRTLSRVTLAEVLSVRSRHKSETAYARFLDLSRLIASPLLLDPQYAGMLDRYIAAYVSGRSMEDAAGELGDLNILAKQLGNRETVAPVQQVKIEPAFVAQVAVRRMTADEIALIDLRVERLLEIRLRDTARKLAGLTRSRSASAQTWYEYAAAEYALVQNSDYGGKPVFRGFGFNNREIIVVANPYPDANAWRAVKEALARDPELAQARRLKAEIMLSRLVRAGNPDDAADYDAVRAILTPLASDAERHPLAAALNYQSYVEQGREAPEAAFSQLARAFMANAGVGDIRYAYATALSRRGDKDMPSALLISMLNDPAFSDAAWRALEATQ